MRLIKSLINPWLVKKCQRNYAQKLEQLKDKKSIKVVFLIRENQKWTYQSLYEEFEKSEKFEPLVLVSLLWVAHIGKDKTRNNLEENYNFFNSRGMNVDFAYKNGIYVDLRKFSPDIVFYEQPWDLPDIHKPERISEYALTCYCPYGCEIIEDRGDYSCEFHRKLYKMFIGDEYNKARYERYGRGNSKNCIITGYPKMDAYLDKIKSENLWKEDNKIKIIYAPHHSFEKNGLHCATFEQNGKLILDLAKKYPQTTWVFRPHPRFKHAVVRNHIMSETEIENYYYEWKQIGKINTEGNYLDIFRTSDLLITDSCSFLYEYLPTKNPIIRINNPNSAKFTTLGNKIKKVCYEVDNNKSLEDNFNELIVKKNDYKRVFREELAYKLFGFNKKSGERIKDYILKDIARYKI
jgi:hypothetical protein